MQGFLTAFEVNFLQLRAYRLKVEHRTLTPDVLVRFQLRLFEKNGNVKRRKESSDGKKNQGA